MATRHVYLDNAATTGVSAPVLEAMLPFLKEAYGNPSSVHSWGREARKALNNARRQVAAALGAQENEYSSPAAVLNPITGLSAVPLWLNTTRVVI